MTACLFGDGAVAEGEFHESMNLAALWKLPVLFLCENNQYAMGTALERHQSQTNLALKAQSYAMDVERVDGMDVLAVRGGRAPRRRVRAARRRAVLHRARDLPLPRPLDVRPGALSRRRTRSRAGSKRDPIALFEALATERGLVGADDVAAHRARGRRRDRRGGRVRRGGHARAGRAI